MKYDAILFDLFGTLFQVSDTTAFDWPGEIDGLRRGLELLSESAPLFIVSNCQSGTIEKFLEVNCYQAYFKDYLCSGDTGEKKAMNMQKLIKKHDLNSSVYIGDTWGDYRATAEIDIPFLHVSYGYDDIPEISSFSRFKELCDYLLS